MARKSELVTLRVPPRSAAAWRVVAAHEDISLSELLRRAADEYARSRVTALVSPRADREPAGAA